MYSARVLFLLFLVFGSSYVQAEKRSEPVPIGAILPLSGGAAGYGVACMNAFTMAMEENKDRVSGKFSLHVEDDQNTPHKTVTALRNLQSKYKPGIVFSWSSSASKAINALAEREGFILVATAASDFELVRGKKNVFTHWVSPEAEAHVLAAELKRRGLKRIAMLTGMQAGIVAIRQAFISIAPEYGLEIVFDQELDTSEKDFRTILSRLKNIPGLDAIFNNLYVEQVGVFARQAREMGMKLPITNIEIFEDETVLNLAQGALEGAFYVNASSGTDEFLRRYRTRFPKDSIFAAANCYDLVSFLLEAPELTSDGFRNYLENVKDFPGASGTVSATGDHRFHLPAVVKVIKGRQFEVLSQ